MDRFYTGVTTEPIEARVKKHNSSYYGGKHFTSKASDWKKQHLIKCENYRQAVRIERHIKKMKSRQYIKNLKRYPKLTTRLLERFNST
jgi:putative endonuclease